MAALVGIVGGDEHLPVGHLAELADELSLHPFRGLSLLGHAAVIQNQHASGASASAAVRLQQLYPAAVQLGPVPGRLAQEMMQPLIGLADGAGADGLDVLTVHLRQQAPHVGGETLRLIRTRPQIGELIKERSANRVRLVDDAVHEDSPPADCLSPIAHPEINKLTK